MKILAKLLTKFKGNIKVSVDSHTDISDDREHSQASVTRSYTLTDVDLSDEVKNISDPDGSEQWADEVERQLDYFLSQLKKEFVKFETDLSSHKRYFENDENLLGFNAEVSLGSFEKKADLSKMKVEIELVAFYDIPVNKLGYVMDEVIEALTNKDSEEFNH
jgi:hypothetical protein